MTSAYLSGTDLAAFGVPNATAAQIGLASTLIDTYLGRPEGCIWTPDASGQPCFMAAKTPIYSFGLGSAIAPGLNVPVNLTGPVAMLQTGDVLILDRANSGVLEAVTIASVTNPGVILQSVSYAHAANALGDYGMVIEEQKYVPENRPLTGLSRTPLMRVICGVGRYAYGRRGDASNYDVNEFNLLAAISKFGGPPVWELFQPTNLSIDVNTGQVWIPAGVMLAYYSEVKLRYVAGWSYANLPSAIKQATATLITSGMNSVQAGDYKSLKAGDSAIVRLSSSLLDTDTKNALAQFRVNSFV